VLHYKATERDDTPFWRHCQAIPMPDTLKTRWDMYRETANIATLPGELFGNASWFAVFNGQGVNTAAYHPFADIPTNDELARRLALIGGDVQKRVNAMPMHDDFIRQHCAGAPLAGKPM
jgi:tryptophan halogenase